MAHQHDRYGKLPNRGFLGDPDRDGTLNQNELEVRDRLQRMVNSGRFNWRVWAVAASGFLTDSYNLFATNVILPSLAFCYWRDGRSTNELIINTMTLVGSIVGQLCFGYLADRIGRTSLYGVELVIVIFSTIGVASASTGIEHNMNIVGWISVWRFVMGVGIGAEYPLSSVITAEWSDTKARGRMLAAVFLMQPLGQLIAQLVGLGVLYGRDSTHALQDSCPKSTVTFDLANEEHRNCIKGIDSIWRIIVGAGAGPALLAIVFRFLIWDSGRYDLEVKRQGPRALVNTARVYGELDDEQGYQIRNAGTPYQYGHAGSSAVLVQFSWADLKKFLFTQGNYKYLIGTSACWFILDFSFYGLGMGNPRTLAKLFAEGPVPNSGVLPSWNTDPWNPDFTIYNVLDKTGQQSLYVVCVSSMVGSILFLFFVNRISRRSWLIWSFVSLAIIFVLAGATFTVFYEKTGHYVTIMLVALAHFAFNFGSNTLTFMIPAEIFPTTYRATCHGISAASGKLGSVIVLAILHSIDYSNPSTTKQREVFITFGVIMAVGAVFAWLYTPNVQERNPDVPGMPLENLTLEELGRGREYAYDGLRVGVRERFKRGG